MVAVAYDNLSFKELLSVIDLIFTSGISTITRKIKTVPSHVLLARNLCVYFQCGQHMKEDEIVCLMSAIH